VFSPDGRWLASGHQNNTARLWDLETGQLRHTFTGHNSDVYAVAFSPDGRRVATGSSDRLIKLWDVDTGQLVQTFEGHGHTVSSVAFSPDGRTLASGSFDTTMKLWEVDTGQLVRTIENDRKWIYYSLAFSPDGRQLASANSDKTIRIWPLESGKRTVIDFDALNAFGNNAGIGDRQLADYLARFGIKVTGNTSPRIAVFDERNVYEGKAIKASSGRGVLMQQGGNPVAYTLEFATPLKSISFNRVALIAGPSGITHPVWKAVAQDANGKTLAEAGETTISSYTNLPPRTFSLTGPGIKRLVVTGDHKGFAAFSSVVLDNLVLTTD
jgi:Tol biopolymer transport system component